MKIDRLIGILSILLQKETVTAPELAKRFEVSRRTINRDIDELTYAGIPIRTTQGVGGGISIAEGYKMDRTLLTSKDMQVILAGLRSLDSVSGSNYYSRLMEKIQAGSSEFISGRDSILIDLSSWYGKTLAPKIETIQNAIENRQLLTFSYYGPKGESGRKIEPYYLVFKWSSWYVWGWCLTRRDFRLFKLNRMDKVNKSETIFTCREVALPDLSDEKVFSGGIHLQALFAPEVKWRVIEEFGVGSYAEMKGGRILLEKEYTNMDQMISWILSFGDKVEVIEPKEVREQITNIAGKMRKVYKGSKTNGKK